MRIANSIGTVAVAIGVELIILALIGVVFVFQFDRAKTDYVNKTRAIAETIGEQASSFFSLRGEDTTSDEFFMFLDQRLGRKKLFNTFEIAPEFFSVVLRKDIERNNSNGFFMRDFHPEDGYSVRRDRGMISVSVPFTVPQQSEPFGIIKIDSNTKSIINKVISNNFLLYLAMLVVLNNQAFILWLFMRRKREVVFEKGYIQEHSIGALKIMHKLLSDIIQDHEGAPGAEPSPKDAPKKQGDSSKKVISLSDIIEKRKQ
ncbi:MAG: hypothetical protein ACT4NX_05135 [Deltaproteobacteria bacterium]